MVVYCARVGGNVKGGLARTVHNAKPPVKMLVRLYFLFPTKLHNPLHNIRNH